MEAGAVIEGGLPERRIGEAIEKQPERLERAGATLAPGGAVGPAAGAAVAATSLVLCQVLGLYDVGAAGATEVGLAAGAGVALATKRVLSSRDHIHDRMRWARPVPDKVEVDDREVEPLRVAGRLGWWTTKMTALLVTAVAVLNWIDSDLDHWPLLFAGLVMGAQVGASLRGRQVRRYEAEHGVELFLDGDAYDEDEDERDSGDPGPMYQRPARGLEGQGS